MNFTPEDDPEEWHFDVLAEREKMLAAGDTEVISLEQFSKELREELLMTALRSLSP